MNKQLFFGLFVSLLFFSACGSQKKQVSTDGSTEERSAPEVYIGKGNEPYWQVKITPEQVEFTPMDGSPSTYPYRAPVFSSGMTSFVTRNDNSNLRVTFLDRSCTDSMSGENYNYSVTIEMDGRVMKGCGYKE